MPIIAPSILTANFLRLEEEIRMINSSQADWIHLDVMDGVFVPNLSFGFHIIRQIRSVASKPLDVHLMITNADRYLQEFRDAGAEWLTVHYEGCPHLDRTISEIQRLGMNPGVALNPHTPPEVLRYLLPRLSMVLIMTVNPGFGAQKFIDYSFEKIRVLKTMIRETNSKTLIQVDGGITSSNIRELTEAGVDVFVTGNAVFSSADPAGAIADLKGLKNQV